MRQVKFGISDNYSEDEQKYFCTPVFKFIFQIGFSTKDSRSRLASMSPEELTHIVNEQNYRYIGVISGETFQRHYIPRLVIWLK